VTAASAAKPSAVRAKGLRTGGGGDEDLGSMWGAPSGGGGGDDNDYVSAAPAGSGKASKKHKARLTPAHAKAAAAVHAGMSYNPTTDDHQVSARGASFFF